MKIDIRKLLLIIFLIALLFNGFVAELIMWISLATMVIISRHDIKIQIGNKGYNIAVFFILYYVILYILQISTGNYDTAQAIRLYGLTKNICAPALMLLAFGTVCKDGFSVKFVMWMLTIFNLFYIGAILNPHYHDVISYQMGSLNGGSGISVVLLPTALYYLKYPDKSNVPKRVNISVLFVFTTLFFVAISGSTTSQLLLLFEFFIYITLKIRMNKKILMRFLILVLIGASLASLIIASGKLSLNPDGLKTRVGIWTRAYSYFINQEKFCVIFGTGDDIVQMITKSLEAHNVFIEIMLIYGVTGLSFFIYSLYRVSKKIFTFQKANIRYLAACILSYVTICSLHPFYTGLTTFQSVSLISIMFLLFNTKNKLTI